MSDKKNNRESMPALAEEWDTWTKEFGLPEWFRGVEKSNGKQINYRRVKDGSRDK